MASTNTPAKFANTEHSSQRDGRVARTASSTSRTPRFIFRSSAPRCTPQFNATPRFLIAGKRDDDADDGIEMCDDVPSSSPLHVLPTRTQTGGTLSTQRVDDVNNDSEDEIDRSSVDLVDHVSPETHGETGHGLGGFDIDEEFDSIFPPSPTARKTKKRRLSTFASESSTQVHRVGNDTTNISSSPEPGSPRPHGRSTPPETSVTSRRYQLPSTPLPASNKAPSTQQPASSSLKHPRFVFQPTLPPQSSTSSKFKSPNLQFGTAREPQSHPQATPARKPHFILPPSPASNQQASKSQSANEESLSPILARRGRPSRSRTSIPSCVTGGAAATVRNWLFDLGARKQASQYTQHMSTIAQPYTSSTPIQTEKNESAHKYFLTGEIINIKGLSDPGSSFYTTVTPFQVAGTSKPGRPAPMTLALITPELLPSDGDTRLPRKVLLFGEPIYAETRRVIDLSELKIGDRVAMKKPAVWEMELDKSIFAIEGDDASERERGTEKWIVAADWEVLEIKHG